MLHIYVIRKVQIKARYYYISMSGPNPGKTDNTKCWLGCGAMGTLIHSYLVAIQNDTAAS